MKILFICIFVIFYAICVHSNGIRVKRGMSPEQRKLLVDTLNADRQKLFKEFGKHWGIRKMEILEYDMELEKQADAAEGKKCLLPENAQALNGGEFNRKLMSDKKARELLNPEQKKIGCNTKFYCSLTNPGQEIKQELFGLCIMGPSNGHLMRWPDEDSVPAYFKYGELLGIPDSTGPYGGSASSSGRIFSLTVFLAILYF